MNTEFRKGDVVELNILEALRWGLIDQEPHELVFGVVTSSRNNGNLIRVDGVSYHKNFWILLPRLET